MPDCKTLPASRVLLQDQIITDDEPIVIYLQLYVLLDLCVNLAPGVQRRTHTGSVPYHIFPKSLRRISIMSLCLCLDEVCPGGFLPETVKEIMDDVGNDYEGIYFSVSHIVVVLVTTALSHKYKKSNSNQLFDEDKYIFKLYYTVLSQY